MRIKAAYISKESFRELKQPGSFYVTEPDSDGEQTFVYHCPCGCGHVGQLNVGKGYKPSFGPSWKWNGSIDKATLEPSVHHIGHWHGWLTDGDWYDV